MNCTRGFRGSSLLIDLHADPLAFAFARKELARLSDSLVTMTTEGFALVYSPPMSHCAAMFAIGTCHSSPCCLT
jgi:hypothetical protein